MAIAAAVGITAAASVRAQQTWFDPGQLPAFTGTVDRYLPNPAGGIDGLLFREGSQVVFPPALAETLLAAAPVGRKLVVYGLRARGAAVVTMLAWAPDGDTEPSMVDQPVWRLGAPAPRADASEMQAAGTVRATIFSPQGEPVGAMLEDGTVVRLPLPIAETLAARLKPGAKLAVSGSGATTPVGRAIAARSIGETPDKLEPVTAAR
jgi:hypothetical protein